MAHSSFQPLLTSEPEDEDDWEPGDCEGAEDEVLLERPRPPISRQARSLLPLTPGRLSLGAVRQAKVAGPLALALAGALVVALLAEWRHGEGPADGLRAARARTRDSVEKEISIPWPFSTQQGAEDQQTGQQDTATVPVQQVPGEGAEDGVMQQTGQQDKATVPAQQVQGGVYYQSAGQGAAVVQTSPDTGAYSQGCDCACCCGGCGGGYVAFCSSLTCPTGYLQREGAQHIECKGDKCSLEADLSMCCNRRSTCVDFSCPSGMALKADAQSIVCEGGSCSQSNCCDEVPTPSPPTPPSTTPSPTAAPPTPSPPTPPATTPSPTPAPVQTLAPTPTNVETPAPTPTPQPPDENKDTPAPTPAPAPEPTPGTCDEAEVIMVCDLNCYDEGVDSVAVELPEDGTKDLDSCRETCKNNEECEAIVYKKDFETTGESTCHGKKDIHTAKCQPGAEFQTEILKHRPWGQCALVGDPHIMQWDRPPQLGKNMFDDYDAGDYILVRSRDLTIHGRFGFTESFPTATSTKGIAVHGSLISDKVLVAGYSDKNKKFIAWYDGKEILTTKGETSDDGILVAKYEDMDPTEFHSQARHTIGEGSDKLESWHFEWKEVPLKIYMLLGPDNVNLVIEMQKLECAMDGLCGNFNCNPDDENAAELAKRGVVDALHWTDSNFKLSEGTFHEKAFEKGTVDAEEVLTNCDADLLEQGREACHTGKGVDDAAAKACLVDVCVAKSVDVAALDVETVSVEQEVEVDIEKN